MPKAPAYLWKNRFGIFYFRLVIPPALRHLFDERREIRKTLATTNRQEGVVRARALKVKIEQTLRGLMSDPTSPSDPDFQLHIITMKKVQLGQDRSVESIVIEADTPEQEAQIARQLLHPDSPALSLVAVTPPIENMDGPRLSEVIEAYCQEHIRLNKWREKTAEENRSVFKLLVEIVGDVPFRSLSHPALRQYKETLLRLPPNMRKVERYRGKSIAEILAMENVERMAVNTINRHLVRTSSLFSWAQKQGYTVANYAGGLTVGKDKAPRDERQIFDLDDLKRLFESKEYQRGLGAPYRYWVPLIGLYSGARLEEICQLHVDDIRLENEIYAFSINGNFDKQIKNKNAKRLIPIHPRLLDLGFLDYFLHLKLAGEPRLFPELKRGRDGYGQVASKWFARYRERCGITESGKVFHSFRHTFINHLKQQNVPIDKIADVVGHEDSSMTSGRYGKHYSLDILQEVVKQVTFEIAIPRFDPSRYS